MKIFIEKQTLWQKLCRHKPREAYFVESYSHAEAIKDVPIKSTWCGAGRIDGKLTWVFLSLK